MQTSIPLETSDKLLDDIALAKVNKSKKAVVFDQSFQNGDTVKEVKSGRIGVIALQPNPTVKNTHGQLVYGITFDVLEFIDQPTVNSKRHYKLIKERTR